MSLEPKSSCGACMIDLSEPSCAEEGEEELPVPSIQIVSPSYAGEGGDGNKEEWQSMCMVVMMVKVLEEKKQKHRGGSGKHSELEREKKIG